jgi:GTP-binding protein
LKRIYILFNAKHGLNETDQVMLESLAEKITSHGGSRHTLQAVLTKADTLPLSEVRTALKRIRQDIFDAAPVCLPPIVTSVIKHPMLGVEDVRSSIVDACGLSTAS